MAPSDTELMTQVHDGRIERLAVLFERHQTMLFNFYLRLTGNRAVSEDLVQEVFMRVLKYRSGFQGDGRFKVWLFQIAIIDFLVDVREERAAEALKRLVENENLIDPAVRNRAERGLKQLI